MKPPKKTRKFKISEVVRSTLRRFSSPSAAPTKAFSAAEPAPGVLPKGVKHTIAMDEAGFGDSISWAGNGLFSPGAVSQGMVFPGYPELAILAQRGENRRIVEILATEMTRKWIKFEAKGEEDKSDRITDLEKAFEKLKVRQRFRRCIELEGYFGRSHLHIDIGDRQKIEEMKQPIGLGNDEVSKNKVSKDKPVIGLKPVEPVWAYPLTYNASDPLADDWFEPTQWYVMGKQIHATRLLKFEGRSVSDLLKPAYSFGGVSITQLARPDVDNWIRTRQSVSDIVHSFSVFVLSTDMENTLHEGGNDIIERVDLFNSTRDNRSTLMIDKEHEDFKNISAQIGGLHELQSQAQEQMCSITGTPVVKLHGIQPAGMNASSEGELSCWSDWVHAYQEHLCRDNLNTVMWFIQLSLWGEIDEDIVATFLPLKEMTEKEQADIQKVKVETDSAAIENGTLDPQEARQRLASDANSPYQGLDPEKMPEPSPEEQAMLDAAAGGEEPGEGEEKEPKDDKPSAADMALDELHNSEARILKRVDSVLDDVRRSVAQMVREVGEKNHKFAMDTVRHTTDAVAGVARSAIEREPTPAPIVNIPEVHIPEPAAVNINLTVEGNKPGNKNIVTKRFPDGHIEATVKEDG